LSFHSDNAWESRRNNLDFLRFFLACVVIHTHSYRMVGAEYTGIVERLRHLDLGGAWLAVDGFFAISGFLITQSWMRARSPVDYFKRRALRIYPGFIAAILLCMFVVGPLGGASLPEYFSNPQTYTFFKPLALGPLGTLPGVFVNQPWSGAVNESLWTIRFELFCYILLAGLGLCRLLRLRFVMLAMFVLAVAVQCAQESQWPGRWNLVTPYFGDLWEVVRFLVFFLAGSVFYLFRDRIPFAVLPALLSTSLLAIAFVFHFTAPILPFCGTYLLLYVGFHPRLPFHNFARFGDFSYGMYLDAFPIQQLLVMYVPITRSNPIVLSLVAFVCTLIAAVLSWHLLEKHFLRMKNRSRHNVAPAPIAPATEPSLP